MAVAGLAGRFVLALVFLIAGASKLSAPGDVEKAVREYGLLPPRLVAPVAATLPAAEVLGAVLLLLGIFPQGVALAMAVALLVFASAMGINLIRGRVVDCGCFGRVGGRKITWFTVAEDLLLAAMAVCSAAWVPDVLALWTPSLALPERVISTGDALAVFGASTALALGVFIARAGTDLHRLAVKAGDSLP